MILLMAAAYLGAALSLLVLWPFGALTAILAMPIGGSLGAVLAGGWLAVRRRRTDAATDAMVASLRALAEEGRDEAQAGPQARRRLAG
jgi:hypothetical protein